jgi:predicted HAD superfamily Cof-like phosphohydrolase
VSRLREQVKAFHDACGIETGGTTTQVTPRVPDDATVRLRLRMITEEYFELLDAAGARYVTAARDQIHMSIDRLAAASNVNLPEFVDALGDIDYLVEGTRLAFGVDGDPIAEAIQASNMAKCVDGKVLRNAHGKIAKPEGWTPPDIAGELRKQGWEK